MASIKCYLPKNNDDVLRLTQFCLKNGIELADAHNVKFGDEIEKKLTKFITYEIRYYHPKEKKYLTKRFCTGSEGRRMAEEEKNKVEHLIRTNTIQNIEKDYPLEKMFKVYEEKSSINHSTKTYARNKLIITHFRRFFAKNRPQLFTIMQLNLKSIEDYRDMRLSEKVIHTDRPPSMKTIRNEVCTLLTMVKEVYERDFLTRNPLERIPLKRLLPLKNTKKQVLVPTDRLLLEMQKEAQKSRFTSWFSDCIEFVKWTGARESDLICLQWKDVDFANDIIYFREKDEVTYTNSRGTIKTSSYRPKSSGDEIREEDFPIHPQLRAVLDRLYEESDKDDEDFVFKNSRGVRIPEGGLRKMTASMAQRVDSECGISAFHSLRHLFADKAFAASMGDAHGARLAMRHKQISTTAGYVEHKNLEKLKSVVNNIVYASDSSTMDNDGSTYAQGQLPRGLGSRKQKGQGAEGINQPTPPSYQTQDFDKGSPVIYIINKQMSPGFEHECPKCQSSWPDKPLNSKCPSCSSMLRKDLSFYLPTGQCIFCTGTDRGTVDSESRICDKCGQYHDQAMAVLNHEELMAKIR